LIYHVNDAKRLLTILSVATREDVYEELRVRLGA
jgi:mRNA-degrading endonuclease RelE of RelBE toxin-antitoxin system